MRLSNSLTDHWNPIVNIDIAGSDDQKTMKLEKSPVPNIYFTK
jgi:hypothetical protein